MRFDPRALMGAATRYAAGHEAPDFERLVGNPTWRQRIAYGKKQVVDVLNVVATTNVIAFVPEPANFYAAGAVALLGWAVHWQAQNGPKPPTNDATAFVAASVPPASDKRPSEHDVEVDLSDAEARAVPAMSEQQAEQEVFDEDVAAADEPDVPPTPREQGS